MAHDGELSPTLVRGATIVAGSDGVLHCVRRPVVAVCNCGLSRLSPWCDNTHKMVAGGRGEDS